MLHSLASNETERIDDRVGRRWARSTRFAWTDRGGADWPGRWPATTDAVAARLRAEAEQTKVPVPSEMFVRAGDYLRESGAPPSIRAALYRVLAEISGVESLGTVPDHQGRVGVGVSRTASGIRHELIFDPDTTQLLGEQAVDATTGQVLSWTSYLESSFVDSVPPGGSPVGGSPSTSLSVDKSTASTQSGTQ